MLKIAEMKDQEGDEEGMLFDVHDKLRELVTEEYLKVEGRCEICLEDLAEEDGSSSNMVILDGCLHRFHLLCVHRFWFMERKAEEDSYGLKIEFDLPTEHECALCRHPVPPSQVTKI